MLLIQVVVLSLVQGLTEFLPVSSSAHLVLVPYFLGWKIPSVGFDVMLHAGTLLAVIFYFYKELAKLIKSTFENIAERNFSAPSIKLLWFIILGSIPAFLAVLLFKDFLESFFKKPLYVSYFLFLTGLLLVISEITYRRYHEKRDLKKMKWWESLLIGFFQAVAIIPGISRSGSTISSGIFCGIRRDEAARFSFLLAIPVILGATLEALYVLVKSGEMFESYTFLGFLISFISGYVAIKFLLKYLKNHSLYIFASYCVALGALTLVLNFVIR